MRRASVICALLLFAWPAAQRAAEPPVVSTAMLSAQECQVYAHIKDNVFTKRERRSIASNCPRNRPLLRRV
jgi:hypothetical protein